MSALLELADRIEKLSAPDRSLEADIAVTQGWTQLPGDNWIGSDASICIPNYLHSIDAAMKLIPRGEAHWPQTIMTGTNPNNPAKDKERVEIWCNGRKPVRANAVTPAIAICAAALRAQAQS